MIKSITLVAKQIKLMYTKLLWFRSKNSPRSLMCSEIGPLEVDWVMGVLW